MAFPTATVTPGAGLTINTLPNAGQTTAANSLPVVLASDQSAVPVKLADTAGTGLTSTTIAGKQRLDVTLAAGSAPGATASTIADQVGGVDGGGLLRALSVDTAGRLQILVPETTFFNDNTTVQAAANTFTGTARDVGIAAGTATPSTYFNAFFFADQTGTANVQCSNDGTTWRTIATAAIAVSTPLLLTVPVMTRYHRVQLVNGATLQTAVMVNSSYSGS